ncbi:MAG: TonB-dependent receptor [Prevotella sp.]|nr:TonB-dependent receptor [Prevotella sp.]
MARLLALCSLLLLESFTAIWTQRTTLSGRITDAESGEPVAYASVLLTESGLWAITDEQGLFSLKNVPEGPSTLTVQCLGYRKLVHRIKVSQHQERLALQLRQEDLRLDEVTVVAHRKNDVATTSYTIDRTTLDNQQILNIGDITTLLPGGKSVNPSLMNDSRLSLRSASQEKGNASFGTAVEVDGVRLDNNAAAGETMGASTRSLSSSDIESVEIVTGIPSVEYGDLSNGVVKVNTRRGKSPFIVEGKINQHTRQLALNKGFELGRHAGLLNVSVEHARSFTDAASPHTAYQRNTLSLRYMNTFLSKTTPLTLTAGLSGNIGGYNSEADPDEVSDNYAKARDNALRLNIALDWLLGKAWLTSLQLKGSFSYADKLTEQYALQSSASTQPCIHTTEEGYFVAQDYDSNPTANIILSPTGYWYQRSYADSKPLSYSVKLKAEQNIQKPLSHGQLRNRLMAGAELTGSHNGGQGVYYEDLRYAPSWRAYRYDELPAMNNLALYAEDQLSLPVGQHSKVELTAGLRLDNTLISGSDYGTTSSLSPRTNARYIFWREQKQRWVSDLEVHAGWGKSVKLPSFQVLYPSPSYADRLAFSSTSTEANKSYYAYHTHPTAARYNPSLRWQDTRQTDIGIGMTIRGTRITLSAFHHRTYNAYMATDAYLPFTYRYTPPSALQRCGIAVANRTYSIDQQTGIVTVSDRTGQHASVDLDGNQRNTYLTSRTYSNASPIDRYGLEWTIDFSQIRALRTTIRLDGNYYYYKGLDEQLFADIPLGTTSTMSGGQLYQYVGYYRGCNATGTGYSASASVANGTITRQCNVNLTLTTHIPRIRIIAALRIECSLYNYRQPLSELTDGTRGYVLADNSSFFGTPYEGTSRDQFIAVYPEYYSTWEQPGELIPFAERFAWARDNDTVLYSDLSKLVVRSNYAYTMNPDRLSAYYSANFSVTKEIGPHVSFSFYANNFFNNMKTVHSSQTDLETSLFSSSYIPSYYYGLSMRLKI